jgi:hypothetical protein
MAALKTDVVTAKLLSGYFSSTEGQKPSILRVLAGRQLEAIDALLLSEAKGSDESIREAAIDGLARRAKPTMASALLTAAKTGPPPVTARALSGYVNIAANLEKTDKAAAAAMYVQAFELTTSDDHSKQALLGIGRLADPAADGLIEKVLPLVNEGTLRTEATMALTGLASRMPPGQKDRAVELLLQVVNHSADHEARRLAVGRLRELGVKLDPARDEGFVTCWWLLGPVDRHGDADWDRLPENMGEVDVTSPFTIGEKQLTWRSHHTADLLGIVDLLQAITQTASAAAYACAELNVETAQEALLKAGSDDGIAIWVNGTKVHSTNVGRPIQIDQDVIKVPLKAGKNVILARIQQKGGAWGFCVRVTTLDGKPIVGRQKCD